MIELDTVTAIPIDGVWLIPLKADITKLFGTKNVQFRISIKDRRIKIESPEISQDLEIQNNPLAAETMIV